MLNAYLGNQIQGTPYATIHKQLRLKDYVAITADEVQLKQIVTSPFNFLNLCDSFAKSLLPYVDVPSDIATKTDYADTLIYKNGKVYGYNCLYESFIKLLKMHKIHCKDKTAVILGESPINKSIRLALQSLGISSVINVGSTDDITPICASILINVQPNATCNLKDFKGLNFLLDCSYTNLNTPLTLSAKELHVKHATGMALLAFKCALGEKLLYNDLSVNEIEKAFNHFYLSNTNIVLVGMDGCGKSKLGQTISKMTNIPVYDSDTLLEEAHGKPAFDLYMQLGEEEYRKEEGKIIAKLSQMHGVIIATGGGVIVKKENCENLKLNGKIYFIDRPVYMLARKNRPLYTDTPTMYAIHRKRLPLYERYANMRISNGKTLEQTAKRIISDFFNNVAF